jgi:transcriptional regulator with XRE-family HTH domain
MHSLGNRIRQARRLSNVTRSELARRVGVKPSAAVQWEQDGGTAPTVRNLIKIALCTNVSFEWLATGRGSSRSSASPEVDAVARDDFAHNLFEEHLLRLAREMPPKWHSPLVDFLRAVLGKNG